MRVLGSVAAFALVVLAASEASAQASGQDVATAQALFDEGKRLMASGNYAEACPKLIESQRIDPGGGTLFAIALCHEGEGKTATAWAAFNLALAEARKDHRADREAAAREHVQKLEPRLTRVRVVPTAKIAGLEVKRDGSRVGEAQWGTSLPIDPGEHTFEATAPGKKAWSQVVDVRGEGKVVDVAVPALEDAPSAPPPPAVVPGPEPAVAPAAKAEDGRRGEEESSQKTWAVVAGSLGLVAAGVGLGFGMSANSRWSEAEKACPNAKCLDLAKKQAGEEAAQSAGRSADISTVLVTTGAVGIVAGLVLWLTAPNRSVERRGTRIVPTATTSSFGVVLGANL